MEAVFKRSFDLFVATVCIILLLPVGLILAALISLETPGGIFFVQTRMGKDEKPFKMYKFRSMVVNNIAPIALGPVKHNHNLVTRTGYFIRRTKLDEIPQFFNVLRGDMSLVGPRPLLVEQVEQMTSNERRRYKVQPGITGWAEVNGNVELSLSEQLMLDIWYIDHYSIWLDMYILIKTLGVVIWGSKRNEKAVREAQIHHISITKNGHRYYKNEAIN